MSTFTKPRREGPRKKRKLPKVISPAEASSLLAAVDDGTDEGVRNRLALELMYQAGLRVSEVVKLKPRDVHDTEGFVDVYDAKGGDGTAYFDAARVGPHLKRWRAVRASWGVTGDKPFICRRDGKPIGCRYLQRRMKKLKAEIGINGICTPHTLRHSFATELLEDDFTLIEVQSALRHAHLQTTAVYLHVRDKSLQTKMSRRSQGKEGR